MDYQLTFTGEEAVPGGRMFNPTLFVVVSKDGNEIYSVRDYGIDGFWGAHPDSIQSFVTGTDRRGRELNPPVKEWMEIQVTDEFEKLIQSGVLAELGEGLVDNGIDVVIH